MKLTFTTTVTPHAAALKGSATLRLWHRETKKVSGQNVSYWHLRSTLTMKASATGKLTASGKLAYAGKWQMRVSYGSSAGYAAATSAMKTFTVR
jgi:hypothetical protein